MLPQAIPKAVPGSHLLFPLGYVRRAPIPASSHGLWLSLQRGFALLVLQPRLISLVLITS